jgi:enhancing lycopene biosynthesis protein 2
MLSDFILRSKKCRTQDEMRGIAATLSGVGYPPDVLASMLSNIAYENTMLQTILDHENGTTISSDAAVVDIVEKRSMIASNPGLSYGQPMGGLSRSVAE